jgi:hypothetical protein
MTRTKEQIRAFDRNRKASLYRQRKSERLCVQCGTQIHPGSARCQRCLAIQYKNLKEHDQSCKRRAVQYLGGKCIDCGLQTDFMSVYDFHHKDAGTKNDGVGNLIASHKPWRMVHPTLDGLNLWNYLLTTRNCDS